MLNEFCLRNHKLIDLLFYRNIVMKTHFKFTLIFSSCKTEETTEPQLKGTLIGWVKLYDEFGRRIADKSGVLLKFEGTNPLITAITDSAGKFQVDNLPQGTFNVYCTKSGFATTTLLGLVFIGGNEPSARTITLTQPSTTVISNISTKKDTVNKVNNLLFNVSTNAPSGVAYYMSYFLSSSPNVSYQNYQATTIFATSTAVKNPVELRINADYRIFPSGSVVYIIAYGDTYTDPSYTDLNTGLVIYSALNSQPSNVASFVMP